jgi:uncharacterized membrane protein
MDYLTIILITTAAAGLIALAWLSGYEFGSHDATVSERALANARINGILRQQKVGEVIAYENRCRPSRKASRKAVRA